jgi:molybdenum cofactor synthesis domain-containing protein
LPLPNNQLFFPLDVSKAITAGEADMKVEIVSIGTELLMSDILDTNAAHVSRSLREVNATITSKVTVGDDLEMIVDALQVALRRADVVLTIGGLGDKADDFTRQAAAAVTGRELLPSPPGIAGVVTLGHADGGATGILLEALRGTLVCLPGERREMAYLLETEVLPYLQRQFETETKSGWLLLRTVGIMESSLKQQLSDLLVGSRHRITFDSFAGQTNIRLWVEAKSEEQVDSELHRLKQMVLARLGDHVYGQGEDQLEGVVVQTLLKSGIRLVVAECYTGRILARLLARLPGAEQVVTILPATTWPELAQFLSLATAVLDNDLTTGCRIAAEQLLAQTGAHLALVVFNNVSQGGVQVLVTLASSHGVSVTQRSFGGQPEHIDHWASTLGLAHLRRWLMVHT